jgi:hypothetical protein
VAPRHYDDIWLLSLRRVAIAATVGVNGRVVGMPPPMAALKMLGLEVRPVFESSAI